MLANLKCCQINSRNTDTPFSQVKHPDFRTLLQYVNPASNALLLNSHNTIHSRIKDFFREGQRRVAMILQSALSSIHITCDAWTSSNHLAAWGMVGHFTSEEGKLECLRLSLTEIKGLHNGEIKQTWFWLL